MLFVFTVGVILTVILWGKKVFAGNSEAFCLYGFLLALLSLYVFCCLYRLSGWHPQGRIEKVMAKTKFI